MTIDELIYKISDLRRDTGTIFDNGYDIAIRDCVYEIKEYGKSVVMNEFKEKVDHPAHYKREGAMECIDEMVIVFGKEAVINFCLCNAYKYRYRAGLKDDKEEDLKKSDWYIKKAAELKDQRETAETTYYYMNEQTGSSEPFATFKDKK